MTIEKDTTALDVSLEFISENQHSLKGHKKGGPYSKQHRSKRRLDVYRLHFEYGYPATKISDMIKVNRNTVSSDIKYWYCKLAKEFEDVSIESWFMKQLQRFESQRAGLYEDLGKTENMHDKLAIQHIIFEIDAKITQLVIKMASSQDQVVRKSVKILNEGAEKNGIDLRFINSSEIIQTSSKTQQTIANLIRKDGKLA